jgi:hypothetical protein
MNHVFFFLNENVVFNPQFDPLMKILNLYRTFTHSKIESLHFLQKDVCQAKRLRQKQDTSLFLCVNRMEKVTGVSWWLRVEMFSDFLKLVFKHAVTPNTTLHVYWWVRSYRNVVLLISLKNRSFP